jgi:hypothetical protein
LWTDAFAVRNFLGMARATAEQRYTELALRLVDRVHHTLGKHRSDDRRTGWMSGLGEKEGESHPTRSGLRIGKKLPERSVGEPFDEQLEWDRDGQYFHYLTKWMQALDQVSRSTKQPRFNLWARELAAAAYKAFSYHAPARPFDGAAGFASMLQGGTWASADPLGIGGLLMDASHLERHADLLGRVLAAALEGLRSYAPQDDLRLPASRRLAFRELGLAIGLHAIENLPQLSRSPEVRALLQALQPFVPLGSTIESFWLDPAHREARTWSEHCDINEVMLATSLLPEDSREV